MYGTFQKNSGVTGDVGNGRCQAEDLHLSPVFTPGSWPVVGDEVTHFYDILTPSKSPQKAET